MHVTSLRPVLLQAMLWTAVSSMALTAPVGAQNPETPDPDRYIVKFADLARGRAALAGAGASVLLDLPMANAAAARIPAQAIQALANNPNIEYIEPDVARYPFGQTTPYGVTMVQANQVSDDPAGNSTVCIIDSGYNFGHEDLPMAGVTGNNDSGAGNWNTDGCGHGTHVAGTVAAVNDSTGVMGVAPNGHIRLHIVRVFGNNCSWTYSSTLIAAAQKCADAGANVISMSLGGSLSSATERNAFQAHYNNGILSVAAAGNAGNTRTSYPASYDSVISVAAIDSAKVAASFSQRNSQVELAAPGVAVRSTVPMGTGKEESLTIDNTGHEVIAMEGSPNLTQTGALVNCGLGTSVCSGTAGKVCLIQRGTNSFAEKVLNCQDGGGVGAVIYNNAPALFSGTLGSTTTTIPSVAASGATGSTLLGLVGQSATVSVDSGNYAFYDGTSMATPHVSAVAALIWSHNRSWTNQQVRDALAATAEDLGTTGRDNTYGFGLIRAKAALDQLLDGTAPPPPPPPPGDIVLSATAKKVKGVNHVDLSWTNAAGVEVFRNGGMIATVPSGNTYTDNLDAKGGGSATYQVCLTGTSTCSNAVTVVF
jgi:serine protease